MRAGLSIIFLISFFLLLACTERKSFNIITHEIELDSVEVRLKYDSFNLDLNKLLQSKIDTGSFSKTMESLTDPSMMQSLTEGAAQLATGYCSNVIEQLKRPDSIVNKDKEVIHFIITDFTAVIGLEISGEELLVQIGSGEIQSMKIDPAFWATAKSECKCSDAPDLSDLIINSNGRNIYKMDILVNRQYQHCWKIFDGDKILHRLLEEAGQDIEKYDNPEAAGRFDEPESAKDDSLGLP